MLPEVLLLDKSKKPYYYICYIIFLRKKDEDGDSSYRRKITVSPGEWKPGMEYLLCENHSRVADGTIA
ncbi:hypothetical protein D7V72_15190 [bacterium D16-36]|nr:hypothetical protein D7V72_15190 [bacterium D16-36]